MSHQDQPRSNTQLFIAAVLLLLSGCTAPESGVSAEGINQCRTEAALAQQNAPVKDRQAILRRCLKTIDARLEAKLEEQRAEQQNQAEQAQQAEAQQQQEKPSLQEAMNFCTSYKSDINATLQSYNEITGELSKRNYFQSNENPEVLRQLEADQSTAMQRLQALIPERMRLGRPLIPDAAGLLLRCNQAEIAAALR